MQGTQVRCLAGEVRSHILWSQCFSTHFVDERASKTLPVNLILQIKDFPFENRHHVKI